MTPKEKYNVESNESDAFFKRAVLGAGFTGAGIMAEKWGRGAPQLVRKEVLSFFRDGAGRSVITWPARESLVRDSASRFAFVGFFKNRLPQVNLKAVTLKPNMLKNTTRNLIAKPLMRASFIPAGRALAVCGAFYGLWNAARGGVAYFLQEKKV
jgi:hypothetical protein